MIFFLLFYVVTSQNTYCLYSLHCRLVFDANIKPLLPVKTLTTGRSYRENLKFTKQLLLGLYSANFYALLTLIPLSGDVHPNPGPNSNVSYESYSSDEPAPIAQLVECPLRETGGHGFDPGPRHTKVVKNGTSCSSLGTQTYGVELGLVDPVSG